MQIGKTEGRREGGRTKEGLRNRAGKRPALALDEPLRRSIRFARTAGSSRAIGHGMAAARGYFHVHARDVIALLAKARNWIRVGDGNPPSPHRPAPHRDGGGWGRPGGAVAVGRLAAAVGGGEARGQHARDGLRARRALVATARRRRFPRSCGLSGECTSRRRGRSPGGSTRPARPAIRPRAFGARKGHFKGWGRGGRSWPCKMCVRIQIRRTFIK